MTVMDIGTVGMKKESVRVSGQGDPLCNGLNSGSAELKGNDREKFLISRRGRVR
jgi:hypothetical protein